MKVSGVRCACILILFSLGPGHMSGAGLFLRPVGTHVAYNGSNLSGGFGSSVTLGLNWGATLSHEAGVSWSRLPWQMQQEWSGETGPGARTGSGDAVSMLVNYCHLLGHSTDRIRPYLGVIAGSTQISGRIQTRLSGIGHAGSPGGRGTTYGGVVGMSVALGRLVSLNLGYRLLQTTGVDYGTRWLDEPAAPGSEPAPRSRFDDFKSHVALLGLTIRL